MGRIYSQLVITFIFSILLIAYLIKRSKFNFEKKHLIYSLKYGIPLIPHALSGFILAQFDRIIINNLCGNYQAGLYSFAYNIGMIMNVIVLAMNKSWVPIFYKKYAKIKF